jgi:hypothetical protein
MARCAGGSMMAPALWSGLLFVAAIVAYPLGIAASLAITLFAMVCVNWWAPFFADSSGNLPRWLYWFQTFDATLDEGWKGGYLASSWGTPGWRRYLARVYWLYRNPAYGFDYFAFGLPFDPSKWRVLLDIETDTLSLFIAVGRGFNIEYGGRFGELKLGWKAWNYWQAGTWRTTPWGPQWRVPLCFTLTPFKRK